MSTTDLTIDTLPPLLDKREGIVLVDFWAAWCMPCSTFAPVYEKLSDEHADCVFGKVNTEEEQHLTAGFGIESIPTLLVFRDGILIYGEPGILPEGALRDLVTQVKSLDMDEVRAKVAAHEAQARAGGQSS